MVRSSRFAIRPLVALALFLVAGLAAGCATHPKPQVTKRFATLNPPADGQEVSVKVFVTSVPTPSGSLRISDLSDQGQASFIKELAMHAKSGGDLVALLGQPILPAKRSSGEEDRTVFQRRVVVSVENTSGRDGDRLSDVHFFMGVDEKGAKFTSWNQFITRYETVDLGAVKASQSSTFSAGLGLKPPQIVEVANLDLSAERTNSLEETLALKQRYVTTGTLSPGEIAVIQQGAVGIDLTGNLMMDVTIDVADHPIVVQLTSFSPLFDNDIAVAPDKVGIGSTFVRIPTRGDNPVEATARYSAVTRRIDKGVETYNEADDVVTPVRSSGTLRPFTLVGADDLRFSAWQLVDDQCRILHILNRRGAKPDVILFSSFESAEDFLLWLTKTNALQVRGRDLFLPEFNDLGRKLTVTDIGRLSIGIFPVNWALPAGNLCKPVT